MDLPDAAENFQKLREHYKDLIVVPTSGEAELSLRRAEQKGLIKYVPGEERFDVIKPQELDRRPANRTRLHQEKGLWGVPEDRGPVRAEHRRLQAPQDERRLSGRRPGEAHGQERATSYLMSICLPAGSTLDDLARTVHSDLHKGSALRRRRQDRDSPPHRLRPEGQRRPLHRVHRPEEARQTVWWLRRISLQIATLISKIPNFLLLVAGRSRAFSDDGEVPVYAQLETLLRQAPIEESFSSAEVLRQAESRLLGAIKRQRYERHMSELIEFSSFFVSALVASQDQFLGQKFAEKESACRQGFFRRRKGPEQAGDHEGLLRYQTLSLRASTYATAFLS